MSRNCVVKEVKNLGSKSYGNTAMMIKKRVVPAGAAAEPHQHPEREQRGHAPAATDAQGQSGQYYRTW